MPASEAIHRWESIDSILEVVGEHKDINDIAIVPGRFAVNVCVSPLAALKDADQGNEFMESLIPSDEELNGNGEGMHLQRFSEEHGLLRLGNFALSNVDCFGMEANGSNGHKSRSGDIAGLRNVFGQVNSHRLLEEPLDKMVFVRFYPAQEHLRRAVDLGKNTTSIPITQIKN